MPVEFGAEELNLFEATGMRLYDEAVKLGGLKTTDPRIIDGGPERPALSLLLDLGLLMLDTRIGSYVPVDPSTVQSRVVAPMGLRGAELLAESAKWASAFGSIAQTWRRVPQTRTGPFTELHGDAIDPFIAAAIADAEFEVLTAQPPSGRDGPSISAAADRDVAALKRGVKLNVLYQHSARRSAMTQRYVLAVTRHDGQVRTLDEFFSRLLIVDRALALIPGSSDQAAAVVVREPSTVAFLVEMFERSWSRAQPFSDPESPVSRDIAAEQRAITIRMLIEGHADSTSAKRLGVSARTYAAYVAELKNEYNAQTRFQLGFRLGRGDASARDRKRESTGEVAPALRRPVGG